MADSEKAGRGGLLNAIEWIGNKLPDPVILFVLGAAFVMVLSQVAASAGWSVTPAALEVSIDEATGERTLEVVRDASAEPIVARGLLDSDGLYWALNSMVDNFMGFAPLGVVLVGMLGIGVAEKTGLIAALLKGFMLIVPRSLVTPTMVFLGIMSSMGLDAGYIVLPPLAAALYLALGRSPLAGIAAVFAGVAAGFNANLFVTGLDPLLAGLSQVGANVIDETYAVAATCNWWVMIASTFVITLTGWAVSSFVVERRLSRKSSAEGGPTAVDAGALAEQRITGPEKRALAWTGLVAAVTLGMVFAAVLVPGGPLHNDKVPVANAINPEIVTDVPADLLGAVTEFDSAPPGAIEHDGSYYQPLSPPFDRWVNVTTPLIFVLAIVPGLAYGLAIGTVRSGADAARVMIESIAAMAPIIVLAFFAAQFIEYLKYSQLDRMMAFAGGEALAGAGLSKSTLLVAFIGLTMVFNLFIGSMSAKYAMFAPIFIPMLMFAGISPELTQAAYRIGDSTTNVITPLNSYVVIILVFMQKYAPKAGVGSLVAMMLPYAVVFAIVWTVMLLLWVGAGIPLGPGGVLEYPPAG